MTTSSDGSLPAPTIFTGRPLRGTLVISHDKRQEHVFDVVQLTLQGEVQSIVRLSSGSYCKIKKPLILMSSVKVANEFEPIDTEDPYTVTYQTEFFFDIPDFTTLPSSHGNSTPKRLPPSMRVVKSDFISAATAEIHNSGSVAGTCDVTYRIVARVFAGGRLKCDASREIILMPIEDIPPPLEPEDFGKEYRLVAATSLRPSWGSRKSLTVVVSSMEPRPLTFPNREEGCESTEVLLHLKTGGLLDGSSERAFVESHLTDCEVQINLEAVTYFSAQEQKAAMSMAEALQSPSVVLKKTKYAPNKKKLRLERWMKGREIASGIFEWETAVSVTTILPWSFSRLPSFFTSLVARRYAFDVQITFGHWSSINVFHKPIKLRIPLQIVHFAAGKFLGHSLEDDDLEAPVYVS
ncbi:hypothetical protein V502_05007 [Pseudogymnoascus sp. VKM F-4520 (FW-2644)]|nr:hypothetical protein V502_05007 [Pseudogymnoascus sp. VKM F-4520 (FW-2644)]